MYLKYFLFILTSSFYLKSEAQILLPEKKITLPPEITETSGMEWINDSVWVTHNDSGNEPELYFLNKEGKLIKTVKLKNTINSDWEDVAFDGKSNLYIADLGNNLNTRKNLMIHRFSLSDSSEQSLLINYASQPYPVNEASMNYDSEALIFLNDTLHFFSKNNTSPYNGICRTYSVFFNQEEVSLKPTDSLKLGNEGYWKNSVTGADINADGKTLAILTYKYVYLFYDFSHAEFFKGKYMRFLLPEIQQREAISFDGNGNLWITDENSRLQNGGFLYFYNLSKIYSGDFFYREPEIGIVSAKTKNTSDEGIRSLQIQAGVDQEGDYLVEVLKNGKVIHSVVKTAKNKIKEEIKFLPDDTYTEIFSVRIYKNNQLLYANKFDPFK